MTKPRVDHIISAADPSDIEDIELRRLIAEALLASDLDLPLIAAGYAGPTLVSRSPCPAWRLRRPEPAARRRRHVETASARYH
jgi:hypothetical protein